jgi:ribosomal protein S18 acetylase RimI-like enzyme
MVIRSIHPGELGIFADFGAGADPERTGRLQTYLAEGYSRPEWCFVAEEGGQFLGRCLYWALPAFAHPSDIAILELPWVGDYLQIGTELLRESLAQVRSLGSTSIDCLIEVPPATFPEKRVHLLEQVGFSLVRHGLRWEWTPRSPLPEPAARLSFRTLQDVGDAVFIDAIRRVAEGSLDSWLKLNATRLGAERAAREHFETARTLKHEPHWWQLAYDGEGDLVGLVMAAHNGAFPIIEFIGVVPEQRGHGYVDDLLAMGTSVLASAGATHIRADTDVGNAPMSNAFRRAGYEQFRTRLDYSIALS